MLSSRPLRRRLSVESLEDRNLLAVDAFMKIGDIKGESTAKGPDKTIDVLSWSWGTSQSHSGGGGGGSGKVSVHDISITKSVDSVSTQLAAAALKGTPVGKVELTLVKGDPGDRVSYFTYELKNVRITSYQVSGSTDGSNTLPMESLSLNFDKINWEYVDQGMKKVKGHSDAADTLGPDINGDGTRDPLFFNYALLADLNQDGLLDIAYASNPNNPNTVVPDWNGDGLADQVLAPEPSPTTVQFQVVTLGAPPTIQLAEGDYDEDGAIDAIFALDLNGDGLADVLTSLKDD